MVNRMIYPTNIMTNLKNGKPNGKPLKYGPIKKDFIIT